MTPLPYNPLNRINLSDPIHNIPTLMSEWQQVLADQNRVGIPTWTEPETLAYCAHIASGSLAMIECGTYMGASANVMLNANAGLHLWCIDKFEVFGTKRISEIFLDQHIKSGRCELIVGDSERGSSMLQHMAGKIDAAWIDDGHSTEDVKRDIRCFLPLLRSGGLLFGHDFDVPHNDVALGVIASLPMDKVFFPVPRVWAYRKP